MLTTFLALNTYSLSRPKYLLPIEYTTVIPVYNEQKNLYRGDKKNFVIMRDSLYISLFTYKLSLSDFAKLFVITKEMYVVRYNQVRYKQVSLYYMILDPFFIYDII